MFVLTFEEDWSTQELNKGAYCNKDVIVQSLPKFANFNIVAKIIKQLLDRSKKIE